MSNISKLHFITTSAASAQRACEGGANWIQLRLKNIGYDNYRQAALAVQAICTNFGATLIINDNIQLALDIGADGVHVGKQDPLPQAAVDQMLGRGGIIGCTANTIDDIIHLQGKPVSYIGLGPFRFTETKENLSPILGLEGYRQLFADIKERGINHPPIVGIGGILLDDVAALLQTGLYGIAVSGAISKDAQEQTATKDFIEAITEASNTQL